jgi:Trypsin-like peptidase domain
MRLRKKLCLAALIIGLQASTVDAALLPPSFIDSVVALGSVSQVSNNGEPLHGVWFTEGTAFFYGYLTKPDPDPTKRQYEVYLVTARHVVEEHIANLRTDLAVRLNSKDGSKAAVQEFTIPSSPSAGQGTWFFHPDKNVDVAVFRVDTAWLRAQGIEPNWFPNDQFAADISKLKNLEVSAGDGIFILGFPMNLAGEQRNYVIVRAGVIARISEMLDAASKTFMADAFVFPGNSGGPVVLKPEMTAIQGTQAHSSAYLIGIVVSYKPYVDMAISNQTHRPRITFEENSGLAEVLPVDYIDQAIKAWRDSLPPSAPPKH